MRMLTRAGAAAAAALVLTVAGTATASTTSAGSGHWRFSYISRLQVGAFDDITAVSPHDVWAVGSAFQEGPRVVNTAIVERWDGSSWLAVGLPAREKHASLTAVAGSSPDDVWVFGYVPAANGPAPFALHWNGRWALRGSWKGGTSGIDGAVALKWNNVWAFRTGQVLHYDGSRWAAAKLSFGLSAGSAVSANDIWAIGQEDGSPILAHYRNGKWSARRVPLEASDLDLLTAVQALPHNKIWVAGQVGDGSSARGVALELQGTKWTDHNPPKDAYLDNLVPDGSGGLWAAVDGPYDGQAVYHYSGRWHTVILPHVKGKSTSAVALAWLPRSTTVFAAGLLLWGGFPDTEGAILRYAG
jgi:hypothetical protein